MIETHAFDTEAEERAWIVANIERDLEIGFRAEDMLVVALDNGYGSKQYLRDLAALLGQRKVNAYVAEGDTFRVAGAVTLANVFRAKGNEAHRVYACRLELGTKAFEERTEVHARNGAFVAMTRTKLWVRVSAGRTSPDPG